MGVAEPTPPLTLLRGVAAKYGRAIKAWHPALLGPPYFIKNFIKKWGHPALLGTPYALHILWQSHKSICIALAIKPTMPTPFFNKMG
jgi:hypothetical protein